MDVCFIFLKLYYTIGSGFPNAHILLPAAREVDESGVLFTGHGKWYNSSVIQWGCPMNVNCFSEITESFLRKRTFPGCIIGYGNADKVSAYPFGTLDENHLATESALYDVASLTKVLATLPAVLTLLQKGKLDLEDPVSRYLPIPYRSILVWHLLTHSSGFPPYSDAYKWASGPEEILKDIYQNPWVKEPGKEVVYSCLNFILLKKIVEKIVGDYPAYLKEAVYEPLGMEKTGFLPDKREDIAPTSFRNGERLRGLVDDELAYYLGGVSGNAGLFSCMNDLCRYAQEWIRPSRVLVPTVVALATRPWTSRIPGDLKGLGWAMHTSRSSDGPLFSSNSYGHTGFTGTSLWIDPDHHRFVCILTNRCFYDRHTAESKDAMWEFRRRVGQIAVSIMDSERAG